MGICKLCLKDKTLLKKSHIIPEFMYAGFYDKNHKMIRFQPKNYIKNEGYCEKPSKGEYESGILCQDCDGRIISNYENYGKVVIYGGNQKLENQPKVENFKTELGISFSKIANLDYQKYKLFHLSILWRSSISSRPLFNQVNLGPHEEIIRKMLLNGEPGNVNDYPILFSSFSGGNKSPKNVITQPLKVRSSEGATVYIFVIASMIHHFYVGNKNHKMPQNIVNETITPNGNATVHFIPEGEGWEYIKKLYGIK